MKTKSLKLTVITFLVACGLPVLLMGSNKPQDMTEQVYSTGMGSVDTLMARYQNWEATYVKSSGEGNIVLPLTPSKTLSTEFVDAGGEAKINVVNGTVDVEVNGLPTSQEWEVWVINNVSGPTLASCQKLEMLCFASAA